MAGDEDGLENRGAFRGLEGSIPSPSAHDPVIHA